MSIQGLEQMIERELEEISMLQSDILEQSKYPSQPENPISSHLSIRKKSHSNLNKSRNKNKLGIDVSPRNKTLHKRDRIALNNTNNKLLTPDAKRRFNFPLTPEISQNMNEIGNYLNSNEKMYISSALKEQKAVKFQNEPTNKLVTFKKHERSNSDIQDFMATKKMNSQITQEIESPHYHNNCSTIFKSNTISQSGTYKPSLDLVKNKEIISLMQMYNEQKETPRSSIRDMTKVFSDFNRKAKLDTNLNLDKTRLQNLDKIKGRKSINGAKEFEVNKIIDMENIYNHSNNDIQRSYNSNLNYSTHNESSTAKRSSYKEKSCYENSHLKILTEKSIDKFVSNYKKAHKNTQRSRSRVHLVDLYDNNADNCKFQPKLSRKSIEIASRLESSHDRLTCYTPKQKKNIPKSIDKALKECTFTPKINKNSETIDKKINPNSYERTEQLFTEAHKIQLLKEKERILKLEQECNEQIDACTFYPTKYNEYQPIMTYEGDVTARMNKWSEAVEKRKKKLSHDLIQKEKQKCSFKPKITEQDQNLLKFPYDLSNKADRFKLESFADHLNKQSYSQNKYIEIENAKKKYLYLRA